MKIRKILSCQIHREYSFVLYEEVVIARHRLGLDRFEWKSFAQLYRNNVSIGKPCYSNLEKEFQIELGT